MIPHLEAKESILMVNRLGVGTGALKATHQQELIDGWQQDARPTEKVLRIGGPLFPVPRA